ncbi:TrmH family RNA methyltransferase [Novosphingobium sp. AAP93]|uniref:TrmH family RNA methyltransferase n=1 Tax=Novosphingobium sp. AAP93 TaxID=1523427 RepID=UPI0009EA1044|nr:TrmH family RNA methyltransferase [Novosphingobium sp. AAP93]
MPFWTYILRCADSSYYTGHTDDLETRIAHHHNGTYKGYTHDRRPVELVWAEEFATREEALANELKIKPWSRAKKEAIIARDWDKLSYFAMPPAEREARASASLGHFPRLRSGRTAKGDMESDNPTNLIEVEGKSPTPFAPSEVEGPGSSPIIVLVRPQLGENIGKAARAMLNFGLTRMRLVAPRDGWPNPSAGPAAAGADIVLAQAEVYDTLAEAVADCAHVYATTVRKRGVTKPVLTPEEAARETVNAVGGTAFVFGPERSGLETDDVALARSIVTVPINPEFGSLNLAQAVILCAYEWSKHAASGLAQPPAEDLLPPAPQEELEGLIAQITEHLEPRDYFKPEGRAHATRLTLRNMLTKPAWNHLEVRTMRGVITALMRTPR